MYKIPISSNPVSHNYDPRIPTVLVIGTEEKGQGYLWLQQQNGFAAVGDWSRFLPVPNCPGKVMSILNKTIGE